MMDININIKNPWVIPKSNNIDLILVTQIFKTKIAWISWKSEVTTKLPICACIHINMSSTKAALNYLSISSISD